MSVPPSKRFRADFNNSFPGANRGPRPMRPYDMEQYNYYNNQPRPYDNNGNNYWPPRHPTDHYQQQPRQEFFERSNFELRSRASDNNGYYNDQSAYPMARAENNFNQNQPTYFNNARDGYNNNNNQSVNYDRNYMHGGPQV